MSSISTTDASPHVGGSQQLLLIVGVCVPGTLLVLATAAMLGGLLVGVDPLWEIEGMTLPEAAALHDHGEVVRLIGLGVDPNRADTVRAGFVHNEAQMLTPLEAAVGAQRPDVVQVLLDNGAVLDPATWIRLLCFADVVEASDVRELLEDRRPADAATACGGVDTPW